MGNDEPVTPVFPNSDYCTGVAGVCSILTALMSRAEEGGSYKIDVSCWHSRRAHKSCSLTETDCLELLLPVARQQRRHLP